MALFQSYIDDLNAGGMAFTNACPEVFTFLDFCFAKVKEEIALGQALEIGCQDIYEQELEFLAGPATPDEELLARIFSWHGHTKEKRAAAFTSDKLDLLVWVTNILSIWDSHCHV